MTTTLSTVSLADGINREHQSAIAAASTALEHARRCGELLLQAKAEIDHGGFLPWIAEHCDVGERQARNYMRIAEHWDAISNRQRASDLSVRQALALTHVREPDGSTWLSSEIDRVGSELKELADMLPGGAGFEVWIDQNITLDNLHRFDSLRDQACMEMAKRIVRMNGLREWLDMVVEKANKRVCELNKVSPASGR